MKVLILGARGMLGTDLCREFSFAVEVVGLDREEVDVTDRAAVARAVAEAKPDVIVNATGYTDVDKAEVDRLAAFELNAQAVKHMVEAAKGVNAKFLHFSTEQVFDGTREAGYDESAVPAPLNVYGESKAAGENYVINYVRGYVVRSSWLFGHTPQRGKPRGMNFIETVLKLAQEKNEVKVVNDQFGKPTSTRDLSQAVAALVGGDYAPGIYHLVNEGSTTWYDVAKEVFRLRAVVTPLKPIVSSEYPSKAKRPQHAVLLNTKFPKLRPWQPALRDYLA